MNDLYISFKYMTSAEVQRTGRDLRSDPSDTGAGCFLRAYREEGYADVVKLTRVPPAVMEDVARALQTVFGGTPLENAGIALNGAVRAANSGLAIDRKRSLEMLRKRIESDSAALKRLEAEEAAS